MPSTSARSTAGMVMIRLLVMAWMKSTPVREAGPAKTSFQLSIVVTKPHSLGVLV